MVDGRNLGKDVRGPVRANDPDHASGLEELISIGSTSVRAHQHAAGARLAEHTRD